MANSVCEFICIDGEQGNARFADGIRFFMVRLYYIPIVAVFSLIMRCIGFDIEIMKDVGACLSELILLFGFSRVVAGNGKSRLFKAAYVTEMLHFFIAIVEFFYIYKAGKSISDVTTTAISIALVIEMVCEVVKWYCFLRGCEKCSGTGREKAVKRIRLIRICYVPLAIVLGTLGTVFFLRQQYFVVVLCLIAALAMFVYFYYGISRFAACVSGDGRFRVLNSIGGKALFFLVVSMAVIWIVDAGFRFMLAESKKQEVIDYYVTNIVNEVDLSQRLYEVTGLRAGENCNLPGVSVSGENLKYESYYWFVVTLPKDRIEKCNKDFEELFQEESHLTGYDTRIRNKLGYKNCYYLLNFDNGEKVVACIPNFIYESLMSKNGETVTLPIGVMLHNSDEGMLFKEMEFDDVAEEGTNMGWCLNCFFEIDLQAGNISVEQEKEYCLMVKILMMIIVTAMYVYFRMEIEADDKENCDEHMNEYM